MQFILAAGQNLLPVFHDVLIGLMVTLVVDFIYGLHKNTLYIKKNQLFIVIT